MKKILSLSEAKMRLNHLVDKVIDQDDEYIITKNGSPAAVLLSAETYEGWKETEEIKADREFYDEVKKGIAKLKKGRRRYSFEDVFGEKIK
ncbi:MAG: type II toxin-antitoxin system Phd/YefM family antitoxin [Deltaproteobacteria bacterium]|nr:type II toxin-antitoxin system Phd/YefM family antitoxin [Deltaproteobacteria bacterium]